MTKERLYQIFDETTGGGAATDKESVRRAERKARNKAKTAAEATRNAAQSAGQAIQAGAQEAQNRTVELGRQTEVWAEETRERETAISRTHERAVERVSHGDFGGRYSEKVEMASRKVGHVIGRIHSMHAGDLVENAKGYVREHPKSIFGALAAGFVVGRLLRR